jgi:hypothetical protein
LLKTTKILIKDENMPADFNIKPINQDFETLLQWGKGNSNSSLRVNSSHHFFLRPLSQKNTDNTNVLSKSVNNLIKLMWEGSSKTSPQSTAEKIIELTPVTIQQEVESRIDKFRVDVKAKMSQIKGSKNPHEQLTELLEIISKHNEELNQLLEVSKLIKDRLIGNRLNKSPSKQTELEEKLSPVLSRLTFIQRNINAAIKYPLNSYLIESLTSILDTEQFDHIEAMIDSFLEEILESKSFFNKMNPLNENTLNHILTNVDTEGFKKEAALVGQLITKKTELEVSKAIKLLAATKEIIEKAKNPSEGSQSLEKADQVLVSITNQIAELEQSAKDLSLLPALRLESLSEGFQQVIDEATFPVFKNVNEVRRILTAFVVTPLQAYLQGIASQTIFFDKEFALELINVLQGAIIERNSPQQFSQYIEIDGFVITYALLTSTACENEDMRKQHLSKLVDPDFWTENGMTVGIVNGGPCVYVLINRVEDWITHFDRYLPPSFSSQISEFEFVNAGDIE